MNNLPVNSLGSRLIEDMITSIEEVKSKKCRGLILTSAAPTVFCAGLHLPELYNPDLSAFRKFYYLFQELNYQLYSAPFLTVAAITGHAPAGGCCLSLTTDFRVMTNNAETPFRIGLNEAAIGIAAPAWLQQMLGDVIGKRQAAQALLSSTLFTTEEAFRVGLVDEMGTDREDTLKKAELYIDMYREVEMIGLIETKLTNRQEFLEMFRQKREFDILNFTRVTQSEEAQRIIGDYMKKLGRK